MRFGELAGQGWLQINELGPAFVLSALIGLGREIRRESAGLRTYTLVGFSAALIMLASKYGFGDVLSDRHPRSLTPRRADRDRHQFHRRRPDFCAPGQRARPDDGADRLVDGGRRHGVRRRPPVLALFVTALHIVIRLRVSLHCGAAAKIPLDSIAVASDLTKTAGEYCENCW